MKLLVTGGAGYIGSVVSTMLLEAEHEVVILDNLSHGHADAVPHQATVINGSIQDAPRLITRHDRFDGVIHLAAYIAAGESATNPQKYWANNLVGSLALIDAVREANIPRFVMSSTAMVYGDANPMPLTEKSSVAPGNAYAGSKLAVDIALHCEAQAHGLAAISLRYFNAAGAYHNRGERHDPETHLIPMALQVAAGHREKLHLYGTDYPTSDGTCIRDYIHVEDLGQAHILALQHMNEGHHEVYNLGTGTGTTNRQVIDAVQGITGQPVNVEAAPRRPGDTIELVASSDKARDRLGWTPTKPAIHTIVDDAWRHYNTTKR